ncbi:MAG: DivIVA domain-containing protein [Deltaproteobacteria bacterium]|nr:DivIVA domain-containing protein [Deltaproteobacteria bacterium]
MKITPMDIRAHQFKKSLMGYDAKDVEALRETAAQAIEDAGMELMRLEERLKDATVELNAHIGNERTLRDAITSAQKIGDGLRDNARKEAELLIAEARLQADNIVKQAHGRALELQDEIYRLKKQRMEMESAIRAVINYHNGALTVEEQESRQSDERSDKLKFLNK